MSLLDTASLIVTPNGYKEGKLYSVIPSDGSGDLSVTRATTATRVNSAGLVELVPYNFQTQSEYQTGWVSEGANITINNTTAPNGTLTGAKIVANATTSLHKGYPPAIIGSLISGATYTASVYMKANGYNFGYIRDGYSGRYVIFNLQTGAVSATSSATGSIENVGDGWYRCIATMNTTTANFRMDTGICETNLQTPLTFWLGDGVNGIYIWGAQLVQGSTAKDYQKTETRLNIPRLDYSNGTCPSLLVEPQRTNLALYSSSFDNAAWVKLNGSVTANIAISPSGIQDADSFIPNTTSGFHALRSNNFNQSSTASHSWFLKANGYSKIAVRESDLSIGNYASFDLSTGTLISTSQSGIIEDYGNGWYRCTLVDTNTGAGAQTSIFVLPDNYTTGDPLIAWSGDGIKGVFAYGAQAELGSYPTSYIPTTSASVTRNADVISKTGISSLIGQTEGTLFVDFEWNGQTSSTIVSLSDGTEDNNIMVYILSIGTIRVYSTALGVYDFYDTSVTASIGTRYKLAVAYANNDLNVYINGSSVASSTSVSIPATSQFTIGSAGNFNYKTAAEYNAVALWKTRLTNTQLAQLTII